MTSRREFVQLAARTATAAMLASTHDAATEQKRTQRATPRRGLPLLDLQQRFVDLRFGMFVHFNMATFQDREWGDPTSPADLFRPTALDTDQWAGAAQSANMTWGLPVANKDVGGKRGADLALDRHRPRLCQFLPQGWSAGGALLFDLVAAR